MRLVMNMGVKMEMTIEISVRTRKGTKIGVRNV